MVSRRVWLWLVLLLCGSNLHGQVQVADSIAKTMGDSVIRAKVDTAFVVAADSVVSTLKTNKPKFYPNPKRALRWSLLTPGFGGGQIYNRDYWKLPFVYAAYGASIYFIFLNIDRYGTMVDHYKSFYFLTDPNAPEYGTLNPDIKTVKVYIKSQDRYADLNINEVKRYKDTYRRWRDWSFFALAATYALAAIEANVAAHLKTFDLSDDLSMRVQPSIVQPLLSNPAPGVRVVLILK